MIWRTMKKFLKVKKIPALLNKKVHIKLEISPHTFVTWVEDADKENIYVAGIADKELNSILPLPGQKIEIYMFSQRWVYQFNSLFKRKVEQPIYLWSLTKPGQFKKFPDRREAYRVDNVIETDFIVSHNLVKEQKQALTKNISVGGLAFTSVVNLPIETEIQITLPAIKEASFLGKIVWKYQKPYFDKWCYGVKFLEVAEYQKNLLAKYINERARGMRWAGLD